MASKTKLYSAWFCPFAQKAWIGLVYKAVDFEYIEQDPYKKTKEWLAINPRGLVPAIVHHGKSVCDSTVCLEYIEDAWPEGKMLLPSDPFLRAQARLWVDHINRNMVTPYYAILMKSGQERQQAEKDLLGAIESFAGAMSAEGPFFQGENFGLVDITWFPWAWRVEICLKHYRNFVVPSSESFARYHQWYAAVKCIPAVTATLQPEDKIVESYQRYADDTAQTLVAEAIRKNTALP